MMVQNPLELYTTTLGFRNYDLVWNLCTRFGIAYLPFLMLMITGLTQPFESVVDNGADISFRRTIIEFFIMALVCYLAVSPAYTLDIKKNMQFIPPHYTGTVKPATVQDTGTSYDQIFDNVDYSNIKIPVLLGLALDISSGITYAFIQNLPNVDNMSETMHAIELSHFSIPLQQEIESFRTQCYAKSMDSFRAQNPDESKYKALISKYGGDSDLNWIGSHVLQTLYYPSFKAESSVYGFSYNSYQSDEINNNKKVDPNMQLPQYGYPTCQQWWSSQNTGSSGKPIGLEARIVDESNHHSPINRFSKGVSYKDKINSWIHDLHKFGGYSPSDVIAKAALYETESMPNHTLNTDGGLLDDVSSFFIAKDKLLSPSSYYQRASQHVVIDSLLPIVQAVLIFLVLMFYPFIMIAGNYSLKTLTGLLFLLFSLIFTSAIWASLGILQNYIDNSISYFQFSNMNEKWMFNDFFLVLYITVPLLFNSLIAGAGVALGDRMNSAISGGGGSSGGGSSSGGSSGGGGSHMPNIPGGLGGMSGSGGASSAGGAAETAGVIAGAPIGL